MPTVADRPPVTQQAKKPKRMTLWRALTSLRLCVILLAGIAATAGLGTCLRTDVYHSSWFVALLVALAVNIGACAVARARLGLRGAISLITHLSVLLILAGGACYLAWGVEGYVELVAGQPTSTCYRHDERPASLGFSLELLDVREEFDPGFRKVLAVRIAALKILCEVEVKGKGTYEVPGSPYRLVVDRDVAEFAEAEDVPEEVRKIEALRGPAMRVAVMHPNGRRDPRWLFAANPAVDMNAKADPNVRVMYVQRRTVANWAARIRVDGEEKILRVNDPAARGSWRIYQFGYDERFPDRTLLRLTRDPGIPIIYLGFLLLCIGVTARLWLWRWIK